MSDGLIIVGTDQFDEPVAELVGSVSQATIDGFIGCARMRRSRIMTAIFKARLSGRFDKRRRQVRNGKAGRLVLLRARLKRDLAKVEKTIALADKLSPTSDAMPSFGAITSTQAFKTVTSITRVS